MPLPARIASFVEAVRSWAAARPDVHGLALVGSYTRGKATPESDVDLLFLVEDVEHFLRDMRWTQSLGDPTRMETEAWGNLSSVRIWYQDGLEVEFSVARKGWAGLPLDPGSARVLREGIVALLDPHGILRAAEQSLEVVPSDRSGG
jgi:predicted nucleotidyltransferase